MSHHIRGRHSRFCRYAGNKASSPAKELNTANVNRKRAATNCKNRFTTEQFILVIMKAITIWLPRSFLIVFRSPPSHTIYR